MKLDLNEIALNFGKKHTYQINEAPLGEISKEIINDFPIKGELVFKNTGDVICVRGFFNTSVSVECSRCLGIYKLDIEEKIDEVLPISNSSKTYNKKYNFHENEEINDYLNDENEPLFIDNIYDLSEMLRQSILVLVPIWAVCKEDCKGLCNVCGVNFNEDTCLHINEQDENAFTKLSELLKDKNIDK